MKQGLIKITRSREFGLAALLVVMIVAVTLRAPHFFTFRNMVGILNDTSVLTIVALAQLLVILTGGIDLSLGSTMALTGMSIGLVNQNFPELNSLSLILIALAFGLALGAFNGVLVAYGRIPAIITTLGTMSIYRGFTFLVSGGQWVSAHEMNANLTEIPGSTVLGVQQLLWFAVIVVLVAWVFLGRSRTGREIYAVGGDRNATAFVGIRVPRIDALVFTLSGMLAGLGGMLYVARYASAQTDTANGFELQAVAACVIGGVSIAGGSGSVIGVVLGAVFLGVLYNALTMINLSPFFQMGIQGIVILSAIVANTVVDRANQQKLARRRLV